MVGSLSVITKLGSSKIQTVPDERMVSPHAFTVKAVIVTDSPGSIKPSAIGLSVRMIESCPGKNITGDGKVPKSIPDVAVPVIV